MGDNGIITQAQNAKTEMEEAELWEKIQMTLVEGLATDLEGDELIEYLNKRFEEQGLDAKIQLTEDGYVLTYGLYTRKASTLDGLFSLIQTVAAVEGNSDDWETTIKSDGTLKITAYNGEQTGDIVIPNIIDGYLVTELGDNVFRFATWLTSVTFNEGLVTIGASAFQNCTNLNCEVKFPSTLTSIGDYAFYYCANSTAETSLVADLSTIINQGITLGKMTFAGCSGVYGDVSALIESLEGNVITEGMFSGFSGVTGTLVIPANITSIEKNAFYGCSGITGLEFEDTTENPSQLTSIGDYAFYKCSSIASDLVIPSKVTSIGEYAFYKNTSIKSLTLNDVITKIGQYAFYTCKSISGTITFPNTISTINAYSFCQCLKLETVTFESGSSSSAILKINSNAFYGCSELTMVKFPSVGSVTIGSQIFMYCASLATLENSSSITSAGTYAFGGCSSLVEVDMSGLVSIGTQCFRSDYLLQSLPSISTCITIGDEAFYGCSRLGYESGNGTDIVSWLKSSIVTSVGSSAFYACGYLMGDFTGSIKNSNEASISLGSAVFSNTGVVYATVLNLEGKTSISTGEFKNVTKFLDTDETTEITSIIIPDTVTSIGSQAFSGCTSITDVTIPDTVTTIGSATFYGCSALTSVTLPNNDSFTSIPTNCFNGAGLTSISIPSNVSQIGVNCFKSCSKLKGTIDISSVTELGSNAFYMCTSMSGVVLSNALTTIGACAFAENCNMTGTLVIPDSVTTMGDASFYKTGYETVTLGSGMTTVPQRFLTGNTAVKTVIIKGNITSILTQAFNGCTNLSSLTMDWTNITSIGSQAFYNCSSLTGTVTLNKSCTYDMETSFYNCGLTLQ